MTLRLALCFALLTGCVVEDDLSDTEQSVESANKLATNKLATNSLAANKLAANKLAASSVASGTSAASLINTADGREVLSYILGCALSSTQSVTLNDSTNTAWTFAGSIGLGSAWTTRALTLDEQRWVSACVYARTNYFGVTVQLSLRGSNPILATTSAERTAYPGLDGGFYGNLFDSSGTPAEYACDGTYNNPQRICANDQTGSGAAYTMCGFTFTGSCYGGTGLSACNGDGNNANAPVIAAQCRIANSQVSPQTAFSQVIFVYLQ